MSSFFNNFTHQSTFLKQKDKIENNQKTHYPNYTFKNNQKFVSNHQKQLESYFSPNYQKQKAQNIYNISSLSKGEEDISNNLLTNITNIIQPPKRKSQSIKPEIMKNQTLIKIQKIDCLYNKIKVKNKIKEEYSTISSTFLKKRQSKVEFKSKLSFLQNNLQLKAKDLNLQKNSNQFNLLRTSDKTYQKSYNFLAQQKNLQKFKFRHSISSSNFNDLKSLQGKNSMVSFSKSFLDNSKDSKVNFSLRSSKVDQIPLLKLKLQNKIEQTQFKDSMSKGKSFSNLHQEQPVEQTARFNYQSEQLKVQILELKPNKGKQKRMSVQNFVIGPCKGQGRFGKVYLAIQKQTKLVVALKVVKKESLTHMFDQFVQQIKLQMFLNHPYIVKLYGFFTEGDLFYIIMEYMQQGSLFSLIKKKGMKLNQIALGLQQMHKFDIIHRDLKPQNIVLSFNVCKICDFGWAAYCKTRRQTNCGTLDYLCPQVIQGQQYSFSVDLWGLGVLLYEMLIGKPPFYNISRKQTIKKIRDCFFVIPTHLSSQAKELIQSLLKKNPEQRLNIESILQLSFFKKWKQNL